MKNPAIMKKVQYILIVLVIVLVETGCVPGAGKPPARPQVVTGIPPATSSAMTATLAPQMTASTGEIAEATDVNMPVLGPEEAFLPMIYKSLLPEVFALDAITTTLPQGLLSEVYFYLSNPSSPSLSCDAGQGGPSAKPLDDRELLQQSVVVACGFRKNEQVKLTIEKPSGIVQVTLQARPSNVEDSGPVVAYRFRPRPEDNPGKYVYTFEGQSGSAQVSNYYLEPFGARLTWTDPWELFFYNFAPDEKVLLLAYQGGKFVGAKPLQMDQRGNRVVNLKENQLNFVAWGEVSGAVYAGVTWKKGFDEALVANMTSIQRDSLPVEMLESYNYCPDAMTSRLQPGVHARLAYFDGNGVETRQSPALDAPVKERILDGAEMSIIDGPVCADGMVWWKIDAYMVEPPKFNTTPAWIPEGVNGRYYLEPGRNRKGCPGAFAATQLRPNINAYAYSSAPFAVRAEPGGEAVVGQIPPGHGVAILDGPKCAAALTWWMVKTMDGITGWVAEYDPAAGFLKPFVLEPVR